jgi:hypothetical protein
MTGRSAPGIVRAAYQALSAAVIALTFCGGGAWSADEASKPSSQQLDEVVVSADAYDRHTLVHDIVPHFVESHSAPSTNIEIVFTSTTCGARATADSITEADTAFLHALYRSDLERKLNIEQGEMRDRMVAVLEKR